MKRWNCILGLAIAACLLTVANAGKPDKPGGKDDPEPSPVIELSPFEGLVWDINDEQGDSIQAVGSIHSTAGGESPFYWKVNLNGEVEDTVSLATNAPEELDAVKTRAAGLNNHGTIVGWASNEVASDLHVWPLLWTNCTEIPAVLPMPNGYLGLAGSMNDDGIVLGQIWKRSEDVRDYSESWIVAWKVDLNGTDLIVEDRIEFLRDTASFDSWRYPKIAESGFGVANMTTIDGPFAYRFLLQFDGDRLGLLLPPENLFEERSIAYGVNKLGTVAGQFYPNGGTAIVMDVSDELAPLEGLPPERVRGDTLEYRNYRAFAVNNSGIAIGEIVRYRTEDSQFRGDYPAMWDEIGTLTLLHADWERVIAINDTGWLGGYSSNRRPAIELP